MDQAYLRNSSRYGLLNCRLTQQFSLAFWLQHAKCTTLCTAPQNIVPAGDDSELHRYATQALMAAAAYGDGSSSPPMLSAAAVTPQPARTGTADASSSHQPDRRFSHGERHNTEGNRTSALPASQARPVSPNLANRVNLLLSEAAAPGQSAHKQTVHSLQTPGFRPKSKKPHPLYTPVPGTGKTTQQKKGKPKAGGGFAIRQPAATGTAATKPINTNALDQLLGLSTQSTSAVNQGHSLAQQNQAGQQDRPGSIAELLGITEPINPVEGIEEMEDEVQDVQHLQSHQHQDSAQQLLDTMLEGKLSPAQERPFSPAPLHHAPSLWTPAARASDTAEDRPQAAVTPAMTLQRQFIASLQHTPAVPVSRHTSSRSQAPPGTLSARLSRIVQLEKGQQTQFQTTGSLGGQTMDVTVVEHRLEGHVIKCRCHKANEADQVFVMFNSKLCVNVNLSPGCRVTLHAPWTDLQLASCSIPVLLCQFVSAQTS